VAKEKIVETLPRVVRIERGDSAFCSNDVCLGCPSRGAGPWFDVVVEEHPADCVTRPVYVGRSFFRFCTSCVEWMARLRSIPMNVERKRRRNGVGLTVKVYAPSETSGNDCGFRHTPAARVKRVALHTGHGFQVLCVPCLDMLAAEVRP